jgi:flavoprotein
MNLCTSNRGTAGSTSCTVTKVVWRSAWAAFSARRPVLRIASTAGERYASVYNIDYSRCIFCGYCVEACPTDAITHGHGFELATYDINSLVYRKEQLLEKDAVPAAAPAR